MIAGHVVEGLLILRVRLSSRKAGLQRCQQQFCTLTAVHCLSCQISGRSTAASRTFLCTALHALDSGRRILRSVLPAACQHGCCHHDGQRHRQTSSKNSSPHFSPPNLFLQYTFCNESEPRRSANGLLNRYCVLQKECMQGLQEISFFPTNILHTPYYT